MENLIKTTAIALTLTATTANAAQIMLGTSFDGEILTQTELFHVSGRCSDALIYSNTAFQNATGQKVKMTYHSREGQFKRYTDRLGGIDYMMICVED